MIAETKSNISSLFASESAGTDCGQCQCAYAGYESESR